MTTENVDVVVIGAGISGLAAALELSGGEKPRSVAVLEAADRPGGVLQTERRDGYLLERSADNFITDNPLPLAWCRRLGTENELISTNPEHRGAYVVCRSRLARVPEGFMLMSATRLWPILTSPVLSVRGKLRLACEPFIGRAANDADDVSLADFVRRRLGREAYERLVQPLVGGIYTADPERLSLRATLPRFLEMEREHGSLFAAARSEKHRHPIRTGSAARYSMFVAPRDGMSSLVSAAVNKLPPGALRLNTRVTALRRGPPEASGGRQPSEKPPHPWQIDASTADGATCSFRAKAVIVALPALAAAELLAGVDGALADELRAIPYADSLIALAGYRREQIGHALDAFGFVVPQIERREILACSFSSVKFAGRAPAGHELLRVFLGGAMRPDQLDWSDDEVRRVVTRELADLLAVLGEPALFEVQRWRRAMPQYHFGHLERVARIEHLAARHAGLALAGNAYHGVGIPHCLASGQRASRAVTETPACA